MRAHQTNIDRSIYDTADPHRRAKRAALRNNPQMTILVKNLRAIVSLLLLGAAEPMFLQAQTPETYTFTTNRMVPDGNDAGLSDVRNINSDIGTIASVKVRLKITGEFNGDLYGYIRHSTGFTVLLNRPGKTAANLHGYSGSGFDVTFQTGASNGDVHVYQNVTVPPDGSPLTGGWEPDGRNVDPANVTDASLRSTSLTNFNGLNAAGDWTLYLADVQSGGTNMLTEWSLDISGAAYPTIAWANPADIVYSSALAASQLNATATYNSTNVAGTFTYTPAAGTVLNASNTQTLSVTFTPADPTAFLPTSGNVVINVAPAPLTITANSQTKTYGAALPALTASYGGFVLGQGTGDLTSLATLATTASSASDAGNYPITANGAASPNYAFSYVAGTLSIIQSLTLGAIASSANPALPGANARFTLGVSAVAPGAGTPTGTVNFRIDGSVAGSSVLSGGAAAFTINTLAHGSHTVVAEFAGNLDFAGATNSLAPAQVINTPPVAGNYTIARYPTQSVKVQVSTLLANDSDADGDTLSLSVSSTSANGGTLTLSSGWVFYAPAAGFTNIDSFTYTITDGHGGSATGTVAVAIQVDNTAGQNLVITSLGNGSFRISGSGIAGLTYRLQYTDSIILPNWQGLAGGSVTADNTGVLEFIDSPGAGSRFYRSVYP
ncbi:MAG TPA: MBG domain-containing protein [Candidatus Acidoferrum sp.]|jgi:subtilisin-like proprotein convertase family protein|nr:MBG domain-containing protein [Candidatus Acidoferrum sp.]